MEKNKVDLKEFKAKRNYVTYLLNKARREYFMQFMEENGSDQENFSSLQIDS